MGNENASGLEAIPLVARGRGPADIEMGERV